jgi:hypothetical protein
MKIPFVAPLYPVDIICCLWNNRQQTCLLMQVDWSWSLPKDPLKYLSLSVSSQRLSLFFQYSKTCYFVPNNRSPHREARYNIHLIIHLFIEKPQHKYPHRDAPASFLIFPSRKQSDTHKFYWFSSFFLSECWLQHFRSSGSQHRIIEQSLVGADLFRHFAIVRNGCSVSWSRTDRYVRLLHSEAD